MPTGRFAKVAPATPLEAALKLQRKRVLPLIDRTHQTSPTKGRLRVRTGALYLQPTCTKTGSEWPPRPDKGMTSYIHSCLSEQHTNTICGDVISNGRHKSCLRKQNDEIRLTFWTPKEEEESLKPWRHQILSRMRSSQRHTRDPSSQSLFSFVPMVTHLLTPQLDTAELISLSRTFMLSFMIIFEYWFFPCIILIKT